MKKHVSILGTLLLIYFLNSSFVYAIDVTADIAQPFGLASQETKSDYQYYSPAENAIDGDSTTYNHTRGDATENWWQVELPSPTLISKIMLQGRSSNTDRLNGAKVYITDIPYAGTLDENDLVATLAGTANEQITTFDTAKSGTYLIVKAADSNNLHLASVEVFGVLPTPPKFSRESYQLGLNINSAVNSVVGQIKATDLQQDTLNYQITGNVPFSIDNEGVITLTTTVNHNLSQSYSFTVTVSDGTESDTSNVNVTLLNGTGVTLERWTGISGGYVVNLTDSSHFQNDAPDLVKIISNLNDHEATVGGNSYGQRLTALLKPTQSGHYIFNLVGDKRAEFWLSKNSSNEHLEKIIATTWHSDTHQGWDSSHAKQSQSIYLEAGSIYAVKVLHKDGGDPNFVAVGWKKTQDTNYTLIPSDQLYLSVLNTQNVIPVFEEHESNYLIPGTTSSGTVIATIKAKDLQGDSLSYSLIGDVPFAVDSAGNISVSGAFNQLSYNVELQVSDGVHQVKTSLTINITSATAVKDALSSGSVVKVTAEELLQATRDEIATLKTGNSLLTDIYQTGAITYATGGYSSQLINIIGDKDNIFPILAGNKNNVLAVAGTQNKSRFSVFASNPLYFFDKDENLDYIPYMKRIFAWLIGGQPIDLSVADNTRTIVLSFANSSSAVERWITSHYPNWSVKSCNDKLTLASCYAGADLIIVGNSGADADAEALKNALPSMLSEGKPILYLHPNWGENSLSNVVENLFEFSFPYAGNYFVKDAADWTTKEQMQTALFTNLGYTSIDTMLKHLQDNDYAFNWAQCTDGKGAFGSQYDGCSGIDGLSANFQDGATKLKNITRDLDGNNKNIFVNNGYRLQKLLILIGDKFRQDVIYPMDKVTTDDNAFMRSYYADHAVYNYRTINPAQTDMGNFSRSNFSHITPITKTRQYTSKRSFRSAGVYALPGKTVKITRKDSSDLTVKVFINTLRSGSTHQYQKNGYKRPKYLKTPSFELKTNESIELTSPYGGPLQLSFSSNDLPVEVTFENVGEHAYWASNADNQSFSEKLAANEYDWAEIATAGFEVHSTLEKMKKSVENSNWGGTAEGLANAVVKYTSNYPHVLAGFKGEGVDIVPEIHDWAKTKGLTIETIDIMKHMNADQATCGYGCSGNPYDAYWSFNPIGHGDIHEMGHSMQKKRFEGFPNHAATNTFSYYTKSRYFDLTGGDNSCGGQPFKTLFATIQAAVGENDVTAYLKTNLWDKAGLGEQYLLKIQAMMHAQKMGKVKDGWHVLARVHILEREMARAKQDWDAKKASVGFSTYTLDEIKAIKNNDWLIIAYSYAAGLDYRNYFDMMGIPYSQKARDQIASFAYEIVPNALFISTDKGYCSKDGAGKLFDRPTIAIDGTQTWPSEDDDDTDGHWNAFDNCPALTNADQKDSDNDGVGDVCDSTPTGDKDEDGIDDSTDNCPAIANPNQLDTDNDNKGNLCDDDDDNDGLPDTWEISKGLDPLVNDAQLDTDNDNLTNLQEYQAGTDPKDADSDDDGIDDGTEVAQGTDPNKADQKVNTPSILPIINYLLD